ncbi:MAG: DUF2520 domain-containing protein [Flavobacteriales bacterium]|nr:DUF2520 domain-containing protein [Flavobacteriales bacterium]
MKTVVILGAGNVAFHLTRAFIENTIQVKQIYNRTLEKAKKVAEENNIAYTDKISEIEKADLYIVTSSDSSIEEISYHIPFENALVVHTSGSMPIQSLKGKYRKGVLYPLQTFTKDRKLNYNEIPFFIETENEDDSKKLEELISKVSEHVYKTDSQQRLFLQMSAVWVCNFVNYMYSVGDDICKKNNLPFDILKPLIKETADKIEELSPEKAQTGPAKRNDKIVIEKHLNVLQDDKLKLIYDLISKKINSKYN